MANFQYLARDRNGTLQTGQVEAVNEDEALAVLQNRGLIVTGLTVRGMTSSAAKRPRRMHERVSSDDKVLFCQQLATLLTAGVPLLKSLEVLGAQVESRRLHAALTQVKQDIEAGKSFRDALARHPRVFTSFWLNLVETGEASGHLAESLNQLAVYLESARQIQRKAVTAMTYPAVLVGAAVTAIAIFMLKIIPTFRDVFTSLNVQLPPMTRAIMAVSEFSQRFFFLIVLGIAAAGYAIGKFLQTEEGQWLRDRLLLRLPVFSQLFIHLQLAQFARGLGALLESGVPILYALEVVEQSAGNKVYGQAIADIREEVRQGKMMAERMERSGLFPAMIIQMIRVGEEVGELGKMLDRVAKYYEERVATFIDRLTVLFEPVAIMFMAVVIGTLVISMLLPIFTVAGNLQIQ